VKSKHGWIEVDGIRYNHDIIIHGDRSVTRRSKKKSKKYRKKYGHTPLADHEIEFLQEENPGIIYIGTGQYGDLPITKEARKILGGYDTVILPTPDIMALLEEEDRPFVAVIHVSC